MSVRFRIRKPDPNAESPRGTRSDEQGCSPGRDPRKEVLATNHITLILISNYCMKIVFILLHEQNTGGILAIWDSFES